MSVLQYDTVAIVIQSLAASHPAKTKVQSWVAFPQTCRFVCQGEPKRTEWTLQGARRGETETWRKFDTEAVPSGTVGCFWNDGFWFEADLRGWNEHVWPWFSWICLSRRSSWIARKLMDEMKYEKAPMVGGQEHVGKIQETNSVVTSIQLMILGWAIWNWGWDDFHYDRIVE